MMEYWPVLKLFLIPIGGGIPSGVLAARDLGFAWPLTAFLYLISDVILACFFEPLMLGFIHLSKRSKKLDRIGHVMGESTRRTVARYGHKTGSLALIGIAFGVDPMTGRSVAKAAGHGFIMGWMFAIAGDMIYFSVLMISTLWLDRILGDGTWTAIIILALMMIVPALINKIKH
ncbi:MAG: hypothetical protein KA715_07450 [Xanthomonadaceae bacterium]|nr:hypothetical protein [Xanthomonadaceae bacterium]